MNERIRYPEIRVVDEDGSQLGVMSSRDALAIARGRGLDLIEVAAQAQPPVCRITDYGKYKYEQSKREKDAAKKQKQSDLKGIKMFPHIDEHDFNVKVKSAMKFLQEGDKVKVTIQFKGREITHPEFGRQQMEKIILMTAEVGAQVEKPAALEGRQMTMILSPKGTSVPKPKPPAGAPAPRPATAAAPPQSGPGASAPAASSQAAAPAPPLNAAVAPPPAAAQAPAPSA